MIEYRDYLQKLIYTLINPIIEGMIKMGVTSNTVTTIGFVGSAVAASLFIHASQLTPTFMGFPRLGWGGAILLFSGLSDVMDGQLVRLGNMSTTFGTFWDSTLDRYSELSSLFGITLYLMIVPGIWAGVVTSLALVGSIMVSYVRAQAEGLGIECKVGLVQHSERVVAAALVAIIIGMTSNLWWFIGGMTLIAASVNITAFWCVAHCYKQSEGRQTFSICIILLYIVLAAYKPTRKLALASALWVLFGCTYDVIRFYSNYMANPIDIRDLYEAERQFFGIMTAVGTLTPDEFFAQHHCTVADLLVGFLYLCWVPVLIAFSLYPYFKGDRKYYLHFSTAFLFANLVGFAGYYIHPAAPSWYITQYGFEPLLYTNGNVIGLGRFDELTGIPMFQSLCGKNANVFAAIPSLHAAYMFVTAIYAVISRQRKAVVTLFAIICMGIWQIAVHTSHRYLTDVVSGIATCVVAVVVFGCLLLKVPSVRNTFNGYIHRIS